MTVMFDYATLVSARQHMGREAQWAEVEAGDLIVGRPIWMAIEEQVEAGETTWSEVAEKLGFINVRQRSKGCKGDSSRLKRRLGLIPDTTKRPGGGGRRCNLYCSRNLACAVIRALELWPVDFDL